MRSFVNSRGRSFHMHMHMCMYQSRRSLPPVPLDIPRPQPRGNAQQPAAATAFRHAWAATYHSRTQAQGAFARLLAERCGAPRPLGRLSRKPFKKSRFELSYPDGLFGCTNDGEDQDEADADLERRAWWRGHAGQATYVGWDQTHASMCNSTASSASRKAPPPPRCCAPSSSCALAYS